MAKKRDSAKLVREQQAGGKAIPTTGFRGPPTQPAAALGRRPTAWGVLSAHDPTATVMRY